MAVSFPSIHSPFRFVLSHNCFQFPRPIPLRHLEHDLVDQFLVGGHSQHRQNCIDFHPNQRNPSQYLTEQFMVSMLIFLDQIVVNRVSLYVCVFEDEFQYLLLLPQHVEPIEAVMRDSVHHFIQLDGTHVRVLRADEDAGDSHDVDVREADVVVVSDQSVEQLHTDPIALPTQFVDAEDLEEPVHHSPSVHADVLEACLPDYSVLGRNILTDLLGCGEFSIIVDGLLDVGRVAGPTYLCILIVKRRFE